ncbi:MULTISPECIES: M23 family metallopeptidase [Pelosinus]|uniref:Peptidase M23 n=1 Tax=Pelosinus fermentans B4 TaxID=1149862 RepID=I9ARI3_9FIRM|nr:MULTISPECIES: M23 family metallopeptidase [Pelosinus]EIW15557.1 Peptidase M23 [Pelosinus fermentans B4]EIW26753.1 Peptidase M23 [Pelosinus fermentans A11]OAM92302.1 Peptidase M23 [Pelosinus fermentans DSM 17108]SDQ40154.1 Peptidase family M23 [Pelosinus fermentans]
MHISNEVHDTQKAGNQWMKFISVRWIVSSMCVLSIFLIILFANYHQSISAGSRIIPEPEPILHRDNGQVLEIEKMARTMDQLATKPSIWPTSGEVTSGFGWRNSPMGGGGELHPGIDIANSMGAPVVAAADGVVVQSGAAGGYGNMVQIDHGNGISTIYGHNSRIIVSAGQSVRKGQVVSYVGSTGKSTGPHLHYEVRVNGNAVDPIGFMVQ